MGQTINRWCYWFSLSWRSISESGKFTTGAVNSGCAPIHLFGVVFCCYKPSTKTNKISEMAMECITEQTVIICVRITSLLLKCWNWSLLWAIVEFSTFLENFVAALEQVSIRYFSTLFPITATLGSHIRAVGVRNWTNDHRDLLLFWDSRAKS